MKHTPVRGASGCTESVHYQLAFAYSESDSPFMAFFHNGRKLDSGFGSHRKAFEKAFEKIAAVFPGIAENISMVVHTTSQAIPKWSNALQDSISDPEIEKALCDVFEEEILPYFKNDYEENNTYEN